MSTKENKETPKTAKNFEEKKKKEKRKKNLLLNRWASTSFDDETKQRPILAKLSFVSHILIDRVKHSLGESRSGRWKMS